MSYKISVDLSGVALAAAKIVGQAMPLVSQAVLAVGNEAAARWKTAVMHSDLWTGHKQPYVNSIQVEQLGDFSVRVFTDFDKAGDIEEGQPAVDQKKYLLTSMKARTAKTGPHKGQLYLIIPFRHNTPGNTAHAPAMPAKVYELARQLKPSRVTGKYLESNVHKRIGPDGNIVMVSRSTYAWGGSLPPGLAQKAHPSNKTDRYDGMVRMNTSAVDSESGKYKKSSSYLTFRIMAAWSNGWIIPAKPGLWLAKGVAQEIEPLAEGAIQEAIKITVSDILK